MTDQFDPTTDPTTRKWASRLGLSADSPYVVGTAEVERIREELTERLSTLESKLEGNQQLWGTSLSQNNQTLRQALELIQQQQQNHNSLTQTYNALTQSLLKFDQRLNGLETKISEFKPASMHSTAAWTKDFNNLRTEIRTGLSEIKAKLPVPSAHATQKFSGKSIQWTPLILAVAIGGLCWFFGSQLAFRDGQLDVAVRWFGGIENVDYWKRVRELNLDRTTQCREQGQSECPLYLP
ncbi:hypothetical protein IFO70_29950 [Phormidium tenue FACHB-886]|nr:hypothetical protein [Phormidium tenue FACHB-886]